MNDLFDPVYNSKNDADFNNGIERYTPQPSNSVPVSAESFLSVTTSTVHAIGEAHDEEQERDESNTSAPPSAPPLRNSFQEEFRTATSSPFLRANNETKKYSAYVVNGNELKHAPLCDEDRESDIPFDVEEIKRIRYHSKTKQNKTKMIFSQ